MKNEIASLMEKHLKMDIHEYFSQPIQIRLDLFPTIFKYIVDRDDFNDFHTDNPYEGIPKLKEYIAQNPERQKRVDEFMQTMHDLQHKHIQKHPEIALKNINRESISHFIDYTFNIQEPETLFYNTKVNFPYIEHICEVFTGFKYDKNHERFVTHIADYPGMKIFLPCSTVYEMGSLDALISLLHKIIESMELQIERFYHSIENDKM